MPDGNGKWVNPQASQFRDGSVPGSTLSQVFSSLSSYLGGIQPFSPAMLVHGGAGSSLGNGTQSAEFQIEGLWCDYIGGMTLGSTSSFGAVAALALELPKPAGLVYSANSSAYPIGSAHIANASNNSTYSMDVYVSGLQTVANFFSRTAPGVIAVTNAVAGSNTPIGEFYATGDVFRWQVRYRIDPNI